MTTRTRTLILLGVLFCCALPWIVGGYQAWKARRRWQRETQVGQSTRERIEEIEAREDESRDASRGKSRTGRPFWGRRE